MSSNKKEVVCLSCNARIMSEFCTECGTRVSGAPAEPLPASTPSETKSIDLDSPPPPPPPRKPFVAPLSLPPSTSIQPSSSESLFPSSQPSASATSLPKLAWKANKDAATGRTYYVNSITGLTTWKMPVELLKQIKPDAVESLSAPELARWTRISLPPPPQMAENGLPLPPSPLQVEDSADIPDLLKLDTPSLPRVASSENLSKQPPRPPPKKAAPRRSPSQPAQLETHRFLPDPPSPPSTPKAPSESAVDEKAPTTSNTTPTVKKKPAPRRCTSQPAQLETHRFLPDPPSPPSTPKPFSIVTTNDSAPPSPQPTSFGKVGSAPPSPQPTTFGKFIPLSPQPVTFGKLASTSSPPPPVLPPPPPPPLQLQAQSLDGWLVMKDQNNREYHFKPTTGEVVWTRELKDDTLPPPPPEEEDDEVIPLPPNYHKKTTSEPLSKNETPLPAQTKPKAQSLSKTEAPVPVTPKSIPKEMSRFIEEVMRPKYGQGQLLKDPELLKSFFVYLINIPENLRHVVFHEFFLGVFWREEILEQLLNFGSWKQWLLILIAEATMSHHEILEYVLMTLIEMCYYFFRKFSPQHNGIRQVHENKHLLLDFTGSGVSRSMADFLRDALAEIDKQSDPLVSFKTLSGLNLRICAWDRKPTWARPDFTAVEWPNLIASLDGQEEYLFFPGPKREFCMPEGGVEFLGLPVLESIVVLFEKLKVQQLTECEERAPELIQLQKYYSTKTAQEYEFFRTLRDFFRFYGEIDCMELQKTGFHLKSKVPPRCTASEIEKLFLNRKRSYGNRVQKKVSAYLSQVNDYYRKVFSGENALPAKIAERPRGSANERENSVTSTSSKKSSWI